MLFSLHLHAAIQVYKEKITIIINEEVIAARSQVSKARQTNKQASLDSILNSRRTGITTPTAGSGPQAQQDHSLPS